jgi:hypothetical protein
MQIDFADKETVIYILSYIKNTKVKVTKVGAKGTAYDEFLKEFDND